MPHTFLFLASFFLLAGVRLPRFKTIRFPHLMFLEGPQHDNHPRLNLSKRPILIWVSRKHVPRVGAGDHIRPERAGVLVRTEAAEDLDEENGEWTMDIGREAF
jgi:hypothetical protein